MTGKRRKRHGPEQIVRKLRDADAMLNAGKDVAAVLQALEVSEATYLRWRNQYGGMKAEEAKRQAKLFQKKLSKDEQILHALDRLTFGPRPGDVERVKKLGLKKWIDLQLHPERIPENVDLETKLEPLESLRMTPMDAVQHYPPRQLLRAIAEGRQPMPEAPLHPGCLQ